MMFRSFTARIFTVSAVALFLEMVAIRLLGAEIRLLAYLSNFILVVCFFSLGYRLPAEGGAGASPLAIGPRLRGGAGLSVPA